MEQLRARLAVAPSLTPRGRVRAVRGVSVRVNLPNARVGDVLTIDRASGPLAAEVVGFDEGDVLALPLGSVVGLAPDDPVESTGGPLSVAVSPELLGRVLDGLGRPLDGEPIAGAEAQWVPVDRSAPEPLERRPVQAPLASGVRAIDALTTLGAGQRMGLFAGSGLGKSTLLGSVAQHAEADVVVVALAGERGREVGEFLERSLGPAGRARSVVVVATSDAPALERVRAPQVATAVAEYFRDQGAQVLLLVDSVTRFARALREVGLSSGEPPARRGYPPSVFAALPRLLERSGQGETGAITALYTVLVEGGDMDEPIADEVRGLLDGHVVLSRELAALGHYPAIDVPASLSRVMARVVDEEHREAAEVVREHLAAYERKRELITLGAYERGGDPLVDAALECLPALTRFLRQPSGSAAGFASTRSSLLALARHLTG